jgi:circadian clock protein KaiC
MLVRLIDTLKQKQITAILTSLTHIKTMDKDTTVNAVSSLADSWIHLNNELVDGRRLRQLLIVKTRGMGHLSDSQEFTITKKGIIFKKTST